WRGVAARSRPSFPTRRSSDLGLAEAAQLARAQQALQRRLSPLAVRRQGAGDPEQGVQVAKPALAVLDIGLDAITHRACFLQANRSEEHTSELQSRENLVCRLL